MFNAVQGSKTENAYVTWPKKTSFIYTKYVYVPEHITYDAIYVSPLLYVLHTYMKSVSFTEFLMECCIYLLQYIIQKDIRITF